MSQKSLEQSLINQKTSVDKILQAECKLRYASKHICCAESVKIIQGIRGSGKTFSALHALHANGKSFAYADLSDQSMFFLNDSDYAGLVEGLLMVYGNCEYAIIDEFTSHHNWKACFETLAKHGFKIIGITSAQVPEGDMADNYSLLNFHPLSFSEYCLWHNIDADLSSIENKVKVRKAFNDFAIRGGLPDLQSMSRPKTSARRLIETILKNDIKGDFRKDAYAQIQNLARYLLENNAELINYKRIAEEFGFKSEVSTKKMVEAIKRSGLLSALLRFAMRTKTRNVYEKLYLGDPVFIESKEITGRLETIVYLQLRRFCECNGYFMHYYANRTDECNFALCVNRKMKTIIQVMTDYSDSSAIKEKVAGLISLSKTTGCTRLFILTDNVRDEIADKGLIISVMPVYAFLLDKNHKIIQ